MSQVFFGVFLDGKTAAREPATLVAGDNALFLQWAHGQRKLLPNEVMPIQSCRRGVQFLRLTDGGTCEMVASPELMSALAEVGVGVQRESAMATVLHGDWRIAAMALAFLTCVITVFYVWLLPTVAEIGAAMIPIQTQRKLGETAMRQVEIEWLSPSELPALQRGEIQARFEALTRDMTGPEFAGLELSIRKSSVGPNAFALPGNFIVLTDELVTLVDGDLDAISGVLAHELGHLKKQHGLRSVVQATALTVLGSALIGDYSSALAAVPASLGHLNYSRHFEAEADEHSFALLCDAHVDPSKTALFFDRVPKIGGDVGKLIPSYLSSHPVSEDRAAYFRRPCPTP
jgi:predicted Zn-dependent protease